MNDYKPDIVVWISRGVKAFFSSWLTFLLFTSFWIIFLAVISFVCFNLTSFSDSVLPIVFMIWVVSMIFTTSYLMGGLIGGAVQAARGKAVTLGDIHLCGKKGGISLAAYIFVFLFSTFLLSLSLDFVQAGPIPSPKIDAFFLTLFFVWILFWWFLLYGIGLSVERRANLFEAIKMSFRQTLRHFWLNMIYFAFCFAVLWLGCWNSAELVLIIVTLPLAVCFYAAAYNDVFPLEQPLE